MTKNKPEQLIEKFEHLPEQIRLKFQRNFADNDAGAAFRALRSGGFTMEEAAAYFAWMEDMEMKRV